VESILRAFGVYAFLMLVFSISGKRSLAQITTFDFVLLLIIGEATQQALLGNDFSLSNAFVVIATIVSLEVLFDKLGQRWPILQKAPMGGPLVIMQNGRSIKEHMRRERIGEEDILEAARSAHGIGRLEEIDYAILEMNGEITIIPRKQEHHEDLKRPA